MKKLKELNCSKEDNIQEITESLSLNSDYGVIDIEHPLLLCNNCDRAWITQDGLALMKQRAYTAIEKLNK